jgi:hypothetical protein
MDPAARRSALELFLAGVNEDGVPLHGPAEMGLPDLTLAELLAIAKGP